MKYTKLMRTKITFFLATPIDAAVYAYLAEKGRSRRGHTIRTLADAGLSSMKERAGISREYYELALSLVSASPVECASLNLDPDASEDADLIKTIYKDTLKKMRPFVVRALIVAGYLVLNPSEISSKCNVSSTNKPPQKKPNSIKPTIENGHSVSSNDAGIQLQDTESPAEDAAGDTKATQEDSKFNIGGLITYDEN